MRRSKGRWSKPWLEIDSDSVFAFALFATMLFISDLGTIGAALFSVLALAYVATRLAQLGEILAPRAFLLVIPCFAILSVLWSVAATETAKYALEFGLTVVVALLLSAAPRPKLVLWAMFMAFGFYIVVALASGQTVDVGNSGETAFSGLTDSKNLLADISAMGLLISLACCVAGIEGRRPIAAALTLVVAMLQIYALIEARSAGALMGLGPAVAIFIFLLLVRHARLAVRLVASAFAVLGVTLAVYAYSEVSGGLVAAGLSLFAKDPTLTGRTYLWQRAGDFIAENALLGKGFGAFWLQGNPDAEGLWEYAGIASRSGFNFHDVGIEILVHLGWVGLLLFATVAAFGLALLIRRVMLRPSLSLCFWFSVAAYEFLRMPIESVGIAPFYYSTVTLFAAFGAAFAARRAIPLAQARRARHRPAYRPRMPRPSPSPSLSPSRWLNPDNA